MAIPRAAARVLLEEAARLRPSGPVLQLGPQVVHASPAELRTYAEESGIRVEGKETELFGLMGFSEIDSIDLHDPSATFRHDLNDPIPEGLAGKYGAVIDGGTMEHVFSTEQVLANVHALLAPGGLAIHIAPTNNYVDHGYYMFGPRFFHDHYRANGYRIETIQVLQHTRRWHRGTYRALPYEPGSLDRWSMGGFEQGQLITLAIARRVEGSTSGVCPELPKDAAFRPGRAEGLPPVVQRLIMAARGARPGSSVLALARGPVRRRGRKV